MILISPVISELFSEVIVELPVHLHDDVTDCLALLVHGGAGLCPGSVLDLQGGVGSLPQPLSVLHTLQTRGDGRSLRGESQEVEREAEGRDILDGEQLHPQPVPVQRQAGLVTTKCKGDHRGDLTALTSMLVVLVVI